MTASASILEKAERVAESVLYEGYVLYPYRLSAVKNRRRWNFGMVFPRAYCESREPSEAWTLSAECLIRGSEKTTVSGKVRFLQPEEASAVRREGLIEELRLGDLLESARECRCRYGALEAQYALRSERVGDGLFALRIEILNLSPCEARDRDAALPSSMAGTHAILEAREGQFLSLTDPPEEAREAAARLGRRGLWPVLVGATGRGPAVLAAPIILADNPTIAPQSHGDLFDCTEIEEILRLRILTLSDEEKEEMRRTDERCRKILEGSERLSGEDLLRLHGTLVPSPASLRVGAKVRVRPNRRADILDGVLAGRIATVVGVECDFEDRVHVAVAFDEDPGRDLGVAGRAGHRFFFFEDEVELL